MANTDVIACLQVGVAARDGRTMTTRGGELAQLMEALGRTTSAPPAASDLAAMTR